MASAKNDGKVAPPQYQRAVWDKPQIRYWDPIDRDLQAERARVQVQLIVDEFHRAGIPVGVHNDRDGQPEYLYRPGAVLTREDDADRVYAALGLDRPRDRRGGRQDGTPTPLHGVHVVEIPGEHDDDDFGGVLDRLDSLLGPGVAVPDHVLHVSPVWCAAIEPIPVGPESIDPGNRRRKADGRDGLVVVVDTGSLAEVIGAHQWLEGVTGDEEPDTVGHYSGHGTFIAGVVRTYAPKASVHVMAVLSVGGCAFESDVVAGLVGALDLVPDAISLSGGTRTRCDLPLLSFEVFWEERLSQLKGTVLVACAGNDGDRGPFWPAAFPWAVSVGALAEDPERRAGFSNHGSWVDVYALGSAVVNAFPKGPYTYREPPREGETTTFPDGLAAWSGTSFAAPMVAGLTVARSTWSGESAVESAQALVAIGKRNALPGVGARLVDASAAARRAR